MHHTLYYFECAPTHYEYPLAGLVQNYTMYYVLSGLDS